jgi:hypothetical protein
MTVINSHQRPAGEVRRSIGRFPMRLETPEIRQSIQRIVCTGCGAEANASCNCGVPYQPKSVRAREAIEANPEKSNRAIADESGLSEATIRRARASDDAPETVTGKDGKSYPAKRPRLEDAPTHEGADAAQDQHGNAEDDDPLWEKIFSGATVTETDAKEWRKRERERKKKALPEGEDDERFTLGDYFELHKRMRKLEKRNNELSAAFNAKEKTEGRNWPVDMTPKQVKRRDRLLRYIAWNQRDLEQLYGEVTGQPSWRVEVTTKDGTRLSTGAPFGTRSEAEFYNTRFAPGYRAGVGDDYASGEVIPCEEKPNVRIEGDALSFGDGNCVLLQWQPVASSQLLEAQSAKTAPLGGAA